MTLKPPIRLCQAWTLDQARKTPTREPSLESHARLALQAKTNGNATKQRIHMVFINLRKCDSQWLSNADECIQFGNAVTIWTWSNLNARIGHEKRQVESHLWSRMHDWPYGSRRTTTLQTAKTTKSFVICLHVRLAVTK